ncbi:MAG TPA: hypothetical protein PK950_01275 [Candidatus Paceibacterota bacterium]|nr:hypothetical protein [Candidatus Paceibacterota bacterium]
MANSTDHPKTGMQARKEFLRSLSLNPQPFTYEAIVEKGKEYSDIIGNKNVSSFISKSIMYFHYETFQNQAATRRKKRFTRIKNKYGVTDFPTKMSDSACPVLLGAMKLRAIEMLGKKEKKGNDIADIKEHISQFFNVVKISPEISD